MENQFKNDHSNIFENNETNSKNNRDSDNNYKKCETYKVDLEKNNKGQNGLYKQLSINLSKNKYNRSITAPSFKNKLQEVIDENGNKLNVNTNLLVDQNKISKNSENLNEGDL